MADLSEKRKKVKMVISHVSEKDDVTRKEARAMVHKYVCGGSATCIIARAGRQALIGWI